MQKKKLTQPDLNMIYHTYRTILEMSGDGFLVIDKEGKIVDINPTYVLKLEGVDGLKQEEIIGQDILDYIPTSLLPNFIHVSKPIKGMDMRQEIADKFLKNAEEKHLISTRATIYSEEHGVMGAVAQVKFYDHVIRLNNRLKQIDQELSYYKQELACISREKADIGDDGLTSIIGVSESITQMKNDIQKTAGVNFNVLIVGETGVGKELVAEAIHKAGPRKKGPFVKLNCSAIPADLFESELFGYEEGAFTGASKKGKKGKFEQANGGTIFLDEIGEMPLPMQAKLLRVLQEREVDVVGGSKPRPIDVRIISATNKDLGECIRNKTFRSDLFFRLNVIRIHVPALRERREDISILAEYFLRRLNEQYKTETCFSHVAMDVLESYNWPGNVRELQNFVERMYAYAEDGLIESKHVPFLIQNTREQEMGKGTLREQMEKAERAILLRALEGNEFNCRRTAESLGIHRSTLYKKMEYFGLDRSLQ